MARYGYARVSTGEQNLNLQIDALKSAQCVEIFTDDGISACAKHRPGFKAVLNQLTTGDTLCLYKLDRAFRSLRHALEILERFDREKINFFVITEGLDTSTPMGRCFYQIQSAFAELERNLISERTKAGMAAAKARGVQLGRPCTLKPRQVARMHKMLDDGLHKDTIAKRLGVSARTIYRTLDRGMLQAA